MMKPIGLSDLQMQNVLAVAHSLRRFQRDEYLKAVYEILAGEPCIGDGVVARAAQAARARTENLYWAKQNMTISSREVVLPSSALRRADGGRWS